MDEESESGERTGKRHDGLFHSLLEAVSAWQASEASSSSCYTSPSAIPSDSRKKPSVWTLAKRRSVHGERLQGYNDTYRRTHLSKITRGGRE